MNHYKLLKNQLFKIGDFSIVPIRYEDRDEIMNWRNEQIYHLRQSKALTKEDQDNYFNTIVSKLFDETSPKQLLFSFLEKDECIGYGGLVHINWIDKHAEISFIMNTKLERDNFEKYWSAYLTLIKQLAFNELCLHKIFTYAFDIRPHLYNVLEKNDFTKEVQLKEHCRFNGEYKDVVIHSLINQIHLRPINKGDLNLTYEWATHPTIRKYSFNQGTIIFEEHKNWFEKKIKDKNTFYYIITNHLNYPLGSVRIDKDESNNCTISYLIDEKYHGNNYGLISLRLIEKEIIKKLQKFTLLGLVQEENIASIKIFRKLNYKETFNQNTYSFSKKYEN
jgi:RimJ/RimL family protein N-acetyltransferase